MQICRKNNPYISSPQRTFERGCKMHWELCNWRRYLQQERIELDACILNFLPPNIVLCKEAATSHSFPLPSANFSTQNQGYIDNFVLSSVWFSISHNLPIHSGSIRNYVKGKKGMGIFFFFCYLKALCSAFVHLFHVTFKMFGDRQQKFNFWKNFYPLFTF